MNTGWSTARLIAVVVVIGAAAFGSLPALDWIPFHVAARLAPASRWSSIYPAASARSLFDVPAGYREAANAGIRDAGEVAFRQDNLTAFVSPPPAAFALAPVRQLSWQTSMTVWRLALAIPVMVSVLWLAATLSSREGGATKRWSWMSFVSVPLVFYVVYSGQPSAWLFVAAAVSMLPPSPVRDIGGGTALGISVLVKATPLVAVVFLWLAGRRRLATIALALAAICSIASLVVAGSDSWLAFGAIGRKVSSMVVTDWNNASVDGVTLMLATGADGMFHKPTGLSWTLGQLCRVVIIGMAVRLACRQTETRERRATAAWLGWLAATPLLWMHYLIVLVPILGVAPARRFEVGLILVSLLSAVMLSRFAGWTSGHLALVLCAVWLASAAWLLSNTTKAPCQDSR